MSGIDVVLYPTDFSTSAEQALPHALFLAEQHDAELHVLHALVLHGDDPIAAGGELTNASEIFNRLEEIAHSEMAALLKSHGERRIRIREARQRGFSAPEVILEYAREIDADLVVMGTHGRRGASHLLIGSVAERVVRHARCPVLTLRESVTRRPIEAFEKILVALDLSPHSRPLMETARQLGTTYGARLELLHVIQDPSYPYLYGSLVSATAQSHREEIERRAFAALDELAAQGEPAVAYERHVVHGKPAEEIVRFAGEHHCDMIVIATHGQSAVERLLIGSTAERVVRRAPCPVWSARSHATDSSSAEPL